MNWILLDSRSAAHLVSNPNSVSNTRENNNQQGIISNGGSLDITQEADLTGVGVVPFAEDGITNSSSMANVVKKGFRVCMDTNDENAIFACTPEHDQIIEFKCSDNGSHFHDANDQQATSMNSQCKNSSMHTKRQVERAKVARNLCQ